MRKHKHLTPEQVQKVVAEVDEWNAGITESRKIAWVTHLWEAPGEWYLIRYEDHSSEVFRREWDKTLRPVLRTSYFGPRWTDNPRYKEPEKEEEQSKPEE